MSTRKYESGYSKLKKRRRVEALIESQKGAMDKFVKTNNVNEQVNNVNQDENENREEVVVVQVNNIDDNDPHVNQDENENREEVVVELVNNINDNDPSENRQDSIDSDTHENREEVLEEPSQKNIYDPSQWTTIDTNLRDLLVENGPVKVTDIDFPRDAYARRFCSSLYLQHMSNGEKHERRWLVYSQNLDKVFCFCCKLFKTLPSTSKLAHEGSNDWRNNSAKLKSHEMGNEHIVNMSSWIDLEMRLLKIKQLTSMFKKELIEKENTGEIYYIESLRLLRLSGKIT
ncbi:zinc finger MYM-type protein 5-like [Trifolium pratense]|uniref:zinc finger MYM-type protein 5-like n=1 Tax=Trifolium pratense TaxID=57577 RepID=UPI001E691B0E|nr:zinc finger MYM-type protein 5-like [Trifolium pratense]